MLWRSSCCAAQGQDLSFQLTGWACSPTRHGGTSSTGISTEGESDVSIRRKKTAIRWDEILATVEDGNWYLLVSPPCNAFSRARFHFQDWLGPRLLRNVVWPEGFPWLSQQHKHVVNEANWFVEQCILACKICHRAGGKFRAGGSLSWTPWSSAKVVALEVSNVAKPRFAWQAWHFVTF